MSRKVRASAIKRALRKVIPDIAIHVEQTGGGTATIYVGPVGDDDRYWLAIGPGAYHWHAPWDSTFHLEELAVGPDNDTGDDVIYVDSMAELVEYVRNAPR